MASNAVTSDTSVRRARGNEWGQRQRERRLLLIAQLRVAGRDLTRVDEEIVVVVLGRPAAPEYTDHCCAGAGTGANTPAAATTAPAR